MLVADNLKAGVDLLDRLAQALKVFHQKHSMPPFGDVAEIPRMKIGESGAARIYGKVYTEIRALSGFERFLLGQTGAEIQACTTEGYIVMVNVTALRSDAIIVSRQLVELIPLLDLSVVEAKRWLGKRWLSGRRSEQRELNNNFLQ